MNCDEVTARLKTRKRARDECNEIELTDRPLLRGELPNELDIQRSVTPRNLKCPRGGVARDQLVNAARKHS
jgi:hypothetical protein